jgi:hypothetical protein
MSTNEKIPCVCVSNMVGRLAVLEKNKPMIVQRVKKIKVTINPYSTPPIGFPLYFLLILNL